MITGLLKGQRADGSFGVHPYTKWTGAHWRLVSLVELGISANNRFARAAARTVLDWIAVRDRPLIVNGLERRHASMEGNALLVCCRLGMARNARVRLLAEVLLRAQWPDGGWNCDSNPSAHRSSFHESLAPIRGLAEFHRASGDTHALEASRRGVELLLEHRLFRSLSTGEPIHPEWLEIHWPHYWHYDFFHGLRAVAMVGRLSDPRAKDALDLLVAKRLPDRTWRSTGRRYWRRQGSAGVDAVDWGDAHEIVTSTALALLS
jgi:hypothetical protein